MFQHPDVTLTVARERADELRAEADRQRLLSQILHANLADDEPAPTRRAAEAQPRFDSLDRIGRMWTGHEAAEPPYAAPHGGAELILPSRDAIPESRRAAGRKRNRGSHVVRGCRTHRPTVLGGRHRTGLGGLTPPPVGRR